MEGTPRDRRDSLRISAMLRPFDRSASRISLASFDNVIPDRIFRPSDLAFCLNLFIDSANSTLFYHDKHFTFYGTSTKKSSLHNIQYKALLYFSPPSLDIAGFYGTFIFFDISDFTACLQYYIQLIPYHFQTAFSQSISLSYSSQCQASLFPSAG